MWEVIISNPAISGGVTLAAIWALWKSGVVGRFFNQKTASNELEAWEVLAASYKPDSTLSDIRTSLMEQAVPWPKEEEVEDE